MSNITAFKGMSQEEIDKRLIKAEEFKKAVYPLSYSEAAEFLKVSGNTVRRWSTGRSLCKDVYLEKLNSYDKRAFVRVGPHKQKIARRIKNNPVYKTNSTNIAFI